jgi:serine/threonine protein kinase
MGTGSPPDIEGYEVVASLGRGGMGEVWLARDLRLDRQIALKLLPPHISDDRDGVARLRLEARAASALNHPNVCTIYALGTTRDGGLFIAMEYIEGQTLRARLTGHPLPIREALDLAAQIAAGLAAAHAAGVIHRDIKPENVMIRADGLVKLLDFGLAKLDPALARADGTTRTAMDTDRSVAGTMAYMSPEQASGLSLDARTDIYSLGAVLYEMVTGRAPFGNRVAALVHDGILNRTPEPPTQLNAEVPSRLEDVIAKTLEKDRGLRYQTVVELRTDLTRLLRDSDPANLKAPHPSEALRLTPAPHRRRRRTIAIGTLVLLGLAAIAAIRWPALRALFVGDDWQEVQLTTNSSENPVSAAAISPDGKSVAYADQAGLHLRLVDGGETHTIASPEIGDINRVLWFPDGTKLVVSGMRTTAPVRPAIWSTSIVGGAVHHLRDGGMEASVSRDGSQIAFVDDERRHVWVMGANGEEPHPVVTSTPNETLHLPGFSLNGSLLGYGRIRTTAGKDGAVHVDVLVESRGADGRTAVLLSDPGLTGGVSLPDGRWLYAAFAEPVPGRNAVLWEAQRDRRTGRVLDKHRLRDWRGDVSAWEFTASEDGTRVVFFKRNLQGDVYVGELTPDGDLVNPRRLTLDDSADFVTNWTPDSRAVLFTSDRNGSRDIFRQALDQRNPETVISGPDDEIGPTAVSSDGAWLYYVVARRGWRLVPPKGIAVLRAPAAGGAREKLEDDSRRHLVLCARPPSSVCVLAEFAASELSIYQFDSAKGRGQKITSTTIASGMPPQCEISPDGSSVAAQMASDRRIRVLSLRDGPVRDVTIAPRPLDAAIFSWSADGDGWYVSSTPTESSGGTDLLRIYLDGRVRVIAHQNVRAAMSAIPSPDGRHIALTQTSTVSNVWMLKSF